MDFKNYLVAGIINCILAWFLCDIDTNSDEIYTWYSGIWHGLFFFPNLILSWFTDTICKAECYTVAYNVFHWIFSVISVMIAIFGLMASFRFRNNQ